MGSRDINLSGHDSAFSFCHLSVTMGNDHIETTGMSIIENVARIITKSVSREGTLQEIARLITKKTAIDVCSIYLYEDESDCLQLVSTVGLTSDSVGRICLKAGEGLTGLVLEEMKPAFFRDPQSHPRYKFFDGSGEEQFRNFLGIPLIYHGETLGVLVVQTRDEMGISEADIPIFTAIAAQIAGAAAYANLLAHLRKTEEETDNLKVQLSRSSAKDDITVNKGFLKGIAAAAGFGKGSAYYVRKSISFSDVSEQKATDIDGEICRFEAALKQSEDQIYRLYKELRSQLSTDDAAIFHAYLMYFRDGGLKKRVITSIREGVTAEYALKQVIRRYANIFSTIEDPYLRERGSDIENVGERILRNLLGIEDEQHAGFKKDTILIAHDLSPAEIIRFRQDRLKGIILSRGGETSHVVILAKSFEIPVVICREDLLQDIKEEDTLIIDGNSGFVFHDPPAAIIAEYRRLGHQKVHHDIRIDALRSLKAQTLDGCEMMLGANIGLLSDFDLVEKYGADHIGLYRTEFPFMAREHFPSEDEQVNLYRRIIDKAHGMEVTIRTLDVGGDKFLPYTDYPGEDNPYLGFRSIRISLELKDIFREQLRAILRTSAYGPVKILFPMISSIQEIREILSMLKTEKELLKRKKHPFDEHLAIGILIEVPATIHILSKFCKYIDFVSIGTNDLTQYILAVDRNNQKVAGLYNPLHPAVISAIYDAVKICKKAGKPVTICGESATNPRSTFLYMGMGVDRLSMNAASVPIIKEFVRKTKTPDARKALRRVLQMEEAEEIEAYLKKVVSP